MQKHVSAAIFGDYDDDDDDTINRKTPAPTTAPPKNHPHAAPHPKNTMPKIDTDSKKFENGHKTSMVVIESAYDSNTCIKGKGDAAELEEKLDMFLIFMKTLEKCIAAESVK